MLFQLYINTMLEAAVIDSLYTTWIVSALHELVNTLMVTNTLHDTCGFRFRYIHIYTYTLSLCK